MTDSEIFVGLGLLLTLAVGCQIVATRLRLPAIVLLLPAGYVAGRLTNNVDPDRLFGDTFSPMVSLGVAVILFESGLDLDVRELRGHGHRVVQRLVLRGTLITWAGGALMASLLLGLSADAAIMLGVILVVSGPTVITPILEIVRPGQRVSTILGWESATIDPIGAMLGALVFHALTTDVSLQPGHEMLEFAGFVGLGLLGGAVGTGMLWFLLEKLRLEGVLATEAVLATVVTVAAVCNIFAGETGLIAAVLMGAGVANFPGIQSPEDRPFFRTIVKLTVGLLFVSISATVTHASIRDVFWPTLGLVAGLVLVVRPLVAMLATLRTSLSAAERTFIGVMAPRGIVAASTVATFAGPLTQAGISGADHLLPATFIVIVATVTLYGIGAAPVARLLGLTGGEPVGSDAEAPANPAPGSKGAGRA